MAPTLNITITVPVGTSNHGDPNLLCIPTKWTDIVTFYTGNYLAHALTIKSIPGQKTGHILLVVIAALIYPYSGIMRGLEAICRHAAWFSGNHLQQAARAGALCIIVRSKDWIPKGGQNISGVKINFPDQSEQNQSTAELEKNCSPGNDLEIRRNDSAVDASFRVERPPESFQEGISSPLIIGDRIVHGFVGPLPRGYTLAVLPSNAVVRPDEDEIAISSSYNRVQPILSIVQILFASATLYKSRGDQLKQYGYAAFGLTVLPYIIMSIVNLLGNVLTQDFSTLYLVRSLEMTEVIERDESEGRKSCFDGVVGSVVQDTDVVFRFEKVDVEDTVQMRQIPALNTENPPFDTAPDIEGINPLPRAIITNSNGIEPIKTTKSTEIVGKVVTDDRDITAFGNVYRVRLNVINDGPPNPASQTTISNPVKRSSRSEIIIPAVAKIRTRGSKAWSSRRALIAIFFINYIMAPIPCVVIAILTRFHAGSSTRAQRTWTMSWLAFATFIGASFTIYIESKLNIFTFPHKYVWSGFKVLELNRYFKIIKLGKMIEQQFKLDGIKLEEWASSISKGLFLAFYSVFAIGGFVVVGTNAIQVWFL